MYGLGDFSFSNDPTDPTGVQSAGGASASTGTSWWDQLIGGAQDVAGVVNSVFGAGGAFSNQPRPYYGARTPPIYAKPMPPWLFPVLVLGGVALLARKKRR